MTSKLQDPTELLLYRTLDVVLCNLLKYTLERHIPLSAQYTTIESTIQSTSHKTLVSTCVKAGRVWSGSKSEWQGIGNGSSMVIVVEKVLQSRYSSSAWEIRQ